MTANLIVWGIVQSAGLQSIINQMTQRDQQQSAEKISVPSALFGGTNKYTNCVVGTSTPSLTCTNPTLSSNSGSATTPLISNQNFTSGTTGWVFTKILAPGTSSGITGGFDAGGTEVGAVGSPSGPGMVYMGVSFFPPSGAATYSATWSNKFFVDLTQFGVTNGKGMNNDPKCSGPGCAVIGSWAWILPRVNPGVISMTVKLEVADSFASGTACTPPHCFPIDQQQYTTLADQTWNYRKAAWGGVSTTGTASGGTSSTLSVSGSPWAAHQWQNYFVTITAGTGVGQSRLVSDNPDTHTLNVSPNWTITPDATSQFSISLTDSGTSTATCSTPPCLTLTDANQKWYTNQWAGYYLSITGGTGTGQTLVVSSNTVTVLTLSSAWTTPPDATSQYILGCPSNTFCDFDVKSNTLLNQIQTTYTPAFWGVAGTPGFYTLQVESDFTLSQSTNPAEVRLIFDDVGLEFKTPSNFASFGGGSSSGTVVDIPLTKGENTGLIQQLTVSTATAFDTPNVQEAAYLRDYATGTFDPLTSGFVSQQTVNNTNIFTGVDVGKYIGTLTAQGLLNQPASAAFDSSSNLWVADQHNNRVLEYTAASISSNGPNAALVVGQSSFTTSTSATSATGLNNPGGIAFDSGGNLWVVDTGNNRILEFTPPFSTGMSASLVIGQATFTSSSSATTASGLTSPSSIAFDTPLGNLWVADTGNNRVLKFLKGSGFTNGESASVVLGQSSFTVSTPSPDSGIATGGSATTLVDNTKSWSVNQWVNGIVAIISGTGAGQSRTVTSNTATTLNISPNWTTPPDATSTYSVTPSTTTIANLNAPNLVKFDSSGNIWVDDAGNNRIVEFVATSGTASSVTGGVTVNVSGSPWSVNQWVNYLATITSGTGVGSTGTIASNTASSFTVGSWSGTAPAAGSAFTISPLSGPSASLVIGQSSFTTAGSATSASGLSGPAGLDFDGSGNLWVADTGNNRVIEFPKGGGFSNGESATLTVGQSSLTTNTAATTQSGLSSPAGVVFRSGNLWVADRTNYRVLEYTAGSLSSNGPNAAIEVGQPSGSGAFTTAAHPNVELLFTATNPSAFHVKTMIASVQDFYKNPNSVTVQVANGWASTSHVVDVFVVDSSGTHCFTRVPAACGASLLPSAGTAFVSSVASASGTTLTDSSGNQGTWTANQWVSSPSASNYNYLYISSGTGAGAYGTISANSATSGGTSTVTVSSWTGGTPSGNVVYFIGETWSGLFVAAGSTGVITLPYTWSTGPVSIKVTTDLGNTVVLNTIAS